MRDVNWQKSSFSNSDLTSNCLEIARLDAWRIALRESEEPSVRLTTTPARLAALLATLRPAGQRTAP
jgi:hypothetical protein